MWETVQGLLDHMSQVNEGGKSRERRDSVKSDSLVHGCIRTGALKYEDKMSR